MKRNLFSAGLMAVSALVFFSCETAEIQDPAVEETSLQEGTEFTINVGSEEVRTTNDGIHTLWAAGDGLTVFHRENGTDGAYLGNDQFTASSEGANVSFSGTLGTALEDGKSYDWWAVYPWKGNLKNLVGPVNAKHNMGIAAPEQVGCSSMAKIAGNDRLMFGTAENVPCGETPSIIMHHLSAVAAVKVKNSTDYPLNVSAVALTGPCDICGKYQIDFTTVPPTYSNPDAGTNSHTITLNVKEAVIAPGQTEIFYMTVLPFTAAAGEDITVSVNGYSKTLTAPKDYTFQAGKIKYLSFDYDNAGIEDGEYFISALGDDGLVYAAAAQTEAVVDVEGTGAANKVLFSHSVRIDGSTLYVDSNLTIDGEGSVDVAGDIDDYKFSIQRVTTGDFIGMYTIKDARGYYLSANLAANRQVEFISEPTAEAPGDSYWDIVADESTGICQVTATRSANYRFFKMNFNGGILPRFTVFNNADAPSFTEVSLLKASLYTVQTDLVPRFVAKDITGVDAAGVVDAEFEFTIDNPVSGWTVSVDSFTGCVSAASLSGTKVTYSVSANSAKTSASGTIVLKMTDDSGTLSPVYKTVNVSQNPARFFVRVTSALTDWTGDYLIVNLGNSKCFNAVLNNTDDFTGVNANAVDVTINSGMIAFNSVTEKYIMHISRNEYVQNDPAGQALWTGFDWKDYSSYGDVQYSICAVNNPNKWYIGLYMGGSKSAAMNNNQEERFVNYISYDSTNKCVNIYGVSHADKGVSYLRYRADNQKFRYFPIGQQAAIQLFRLEDE